MLKSIQLVLAILMAGSISLANTSSVDTLVEQIELTEQSRVTCYNSVTINKDPKAQCQAICKTFLDEIGNTENMLADGDFEQRVLDLMDDVVKQWYEFYQETATYCGSF